MHFWRSKFAKTGKNDDKACHALFYHGLLSNVHVKRESSSSTEADQLLTLDSEEIKNKQTEFPFFLTAHHEIVGLPFMSKENHV